MARLDHIHTEFPDLTDKIAELRAADNAFREICDDFELLADVLAKNNQVSGADVTIRFADELASFRALKEELRAYLVPPKTKQTDPAPNPPTGPNLAGSAPIANHKTR